MTTTFITHRPSQLVAAAAVVAALAVGTLGISVSMAEHHSRPTDPAGKHSQTVPTSKPAQQRYVHFATGGGRVLLGE
jgi:hypothetical protein